MKKQIKIPLQIREIFNQEYLDLDLLIKIFSSDNKEINEFMTNLTPLFKEFIKKEFPAVAFLLKI